MNLDARTWIVDVQADTTLELCDLVFSGFEFCFFGGHSFLLLVFLFSFPGEGFLVILRPVSTSPPQVGARCPFRAREWGFVRTTF